MCTYILLDVEEMLRMAEERSRNRRARERTRRLFSSAGARVQRCMQVLYVILRGTIFGTVGARVEIDV